MNLLAKWEAEMAVMVNSWDSLRRATLGATVASWDADMARAAPAAAELRSAGRWRIGPTSWLGVLGRERHEMTHSRLLGWLCDPLGQHGLGDRFLHRLLEELDYPHPEEAAEATVALEVVGPSTRTRADVVIQMRTASVVIENKVDAVESEDQCLLLARDHPPPAHLVLLSPYQDRPRQAGASEPRWKAIRWHSVAALADATVADANGPAAHIAVEYAATLRRQFP